MGVRITKDHACELCGWMGQQVKVIEDSYGDVAATICVDPEGCRAGVEEAFHIERMAEEDAYRRQAEQGNSAWAL